MSGSLIDSVSVEELVATLSRTHLPTIVVEVSDEAIVLRTFEQENIQTSVSVFPVGGKSRLLQIYDLLRGRLAAAPILFLCDRDLWCLQGVPTQYDVSRIVLKDGFSIENDIIRDVRALDFMLVTERERFERELEMFLDWFCFAVVLQVDAADVEMGVHPNRVIDDGLHGLEVVSARANGVLDTPACSLLRSNPMRFLRGKSLMQLVLRQLSASSRGVKHSRTGLLEVAAVHRGPLLERLFSELLMKLQVP